MIKELPAKKVRKICPLESLSCSSTKELKPLQSIIGQSRALQAIQFGLGIGEKGFNIYAAGQQGTGRTSAIKTFLDSQASEKETPLDWCYVYNFKDAYCPKALSLPAGKGREFKQDMTLRWSLVQSTSFFTMVACPGPILRNLGSGILWSSGTRSWNKSPRTYRSISKTCWRKGRAFFLASWMKSTVRTCTPISILATHTATH